MEDLNIHQLATVEEMFPTLLYPFQYQDISYSGRKGEVNVTVMELGSRWSEKVNEQ